MNLGRDDAVRIRPWEPGDLPLLERTMGDPAMTVYLGGPETPEKLQERHQRFLKATGESEYVFVILVGEEASPAGSVCCWESEWEGVAIWEVGWSVLPEFQRRGIATAGTALAIERLRSLDRHRFVHAFPRVDNTASNVVCRKLGFEMCGEVDNEYPPGCAIRSNNWRLDLLGGRSG